MQTITIFPQPSVQPKKYIVENQQKFGELAQKSTNSCWINGSQSFDQKINTFSGNLRKSNSFIQCVLECYNQHHCLKITPDIIYVALLIQFCTYVNNYSDQIYEKIFAIDSTQEKGKKLLFVYESGDEKDLKTFRFDQMFEKFSQHLSKVVKDPKICDIFDCNFSTSTKNDQIVAKLLLGATMKNFAEYHGYPCCGIPKIEVLGNLQDWKTIMDNCISLEQYDCGDGELLKWLNLIYPIIDQFIQLYSNDNNNPNENDFWSKMVRKITGGSGFNHIDGWLTAFTFFRMDFHQNYDYKLSDLKPFSLTFQDKEIVYPFVHQSQISNAIVTFDVNLHNFSSKDIKAEINVGQFLYSVEQDEQDNNVIVPQNDWFAVYDASRSQKDHNINNLFDWMIGVEVKMCPDSKKTYIKQFTDLLKFMSPIYQDQHWERKKFRDGKLDKFLHFVVSSINKTNLSEPSFCVKCFSKGSLNCEVYQGAKWIDSFIIERPPIICSDSKYDCVCSPYIIPFLRQWLDNNYVCTEMPFFQEAENSRMSLGHLIYKSFDRPYDGTIRLVRLETPIDKMVKIHPIENFDHKIIDIFGSDKNECLCNSETSDGRNWKNPLEFIKFRNSFDQHVQNCLTISIKKFLWNQSKCKLFRDCLQKHILQIIVSYQGKVFDDFHIICENPINISYPKNQIYQFVYQWMINNVEFVDSTLIKDPMNKFNFVPLNTSERDNLTWNFYLEKNDFKFKFPTPNHYMLPIFEPSEELYQELKSSLCCCDTNNRVRLICKIEQDPFNDQQMLLCYEIKFKKFKYQGMKFQQPDRKLGSFVYNKDETPDVFISKFLNVPNFLDPQQNCFNLVHQQPNCYEYSIPLKIAVEKFGLDLSSY